MLSASAPAIGIFFFFTVGTQLFPLTIFFMYRISLETDSSMVAIKYFYTKYRCCMQYQHFRNASANSIKRTDCLLSRPLPHSGYFFCSYDY